MKLLEELTVAVHVHSKRFKLSNFEDLRHRLRNESLLPVSVGRMNAEVAECNAEGKRSPTRHIVFIPDVNIADFDLNIVDDLRRQLFGECFILFWLV